MSMNPLKLYNHQRPIHTDIALLFSDFSARFERFERHWFSRPNHAQRVFFSTFLDLLMTILARTPRRGVPQKQVKRTAKQKFHICQSETSRVFLGHTYFDTVNVSIIR